MKESLRNVGYFLQDAPFLIGMVNLAVGRTRTDLLDNIRHCWDGRSLDWYPMTEKCEGTGLRGHILFEN